MTAVVYCVMSIYRTRQTLLERLRDRYDDSSWQEFIDTYRGYIFVVIRRMNIDEADAEDLVQQVLIKMWEKLPDFAYDSKKRFRSFLATVTRNKVNDFIRSRMAELSRMEKMAGESEIDSLQNINVPDIEVIINKEWELFVSNLALKKIRETSSAESVENFERIMNGEDAAAIAAEKNINKNTVHQNVKRIKDKMIVEINRLRYELE